MQLVSSLPWQSSPDYQAPVALVSVDFNIDGQWQFNLQSFYDQWNTAPRYIVVDNLTNANVVTLSFGPGYAMPVNQFSRLTIPVPNGVAQCVVSGIPSTNPVQLIFAINNLGIADTSNLFAIQQATATGAALEVITTYPGSHAIDHLALNHIENFLIAGVAAALLPDPAADPIATPNGWNCQVWNDPASTATLTLDADGGALINGLATIDVIPGMKLRLVTDGVNYFTEIVDYHAAVIVAGATVLLPSADGTVIVVDNGGVAFDIDLPPITLVRPGWSITVVARQDQTVTAALATDLLADGLVFKGLNAIRLNFNRRGTSLKVTFVGGVVGWLVTGQLVNRAGPMALVAGNTQLINTGGYTPGGVLPIDQFYSRFVCTVANNGYAVGDQISADHVGINVGTGFTIKDVDAAGIAALLANATLHFASGATGAIVALNVAQWQWFFDFYIRG